jgi:serine phosphatase RsbU (regulator of sigma subunit)
MKLGFLNTGFPKITFVFLLVIGIVVANIGFNYFIIKNNKARIAEMTEVINPYIESLEKFKLIVTESKMYTTNWVYLQNSIDDKANLDSLHKIQFPSLKKKLDSQLMKFDKKLDGDSLVDAFLKFYDLIKVEKDIMATLVTFDDYENPQKKFKCEELIESEVLPRTQIIMNKLKGLIKRNREQAADLNAEIQQDSSRMTNIMLGASIGLFIFIMLAVSFISGGIREPVLKMKNIILQLGRGELPREKIQANNDVIGDMATSVNTLSDSFTRTSVFASEIGKGNLTVDYEKLSDNDLLGNALINMRNSLKAYSEDMEKQVQERTFEVIEKSAKLKIAYSEIRDSISYAKRIQESILPAEHMITDVFDNSFIFYRPKDVVCGDFYWFARIGNEAIICAVDCTGHGVPGAFMTVIGNSLLNQIITFSGVTNPATILSHLDQKLHQTLKQHGNIITNDGMDAAICRYKIGKNEVTFSGAKRPLYYFKKGELVEIKGNKSPIGSFAHNLDKNFSEHKIAVSPGDTLYMFSDGLQDQFGGNDGKKFMISRFRNMLQSIQPLSMKDQAKRIETEINAWQRDYEQTDDMLLIGIRF